MGKLGFNYRKLFDNYNLDIEAIIFRHVESLRKISAYLVYGQYAFAAGESYVLRVSDSLFVWNKLVML